MGEGKSISSIGSTQDVGSEITLHQIDSENAGASGHIGDETNVESDTDMVYGFDEEELDCALKIVSMYKQHIAAVRVGDDINRKKKFKRHSNRKSKNQRNAK